MVDGLPPQVASKSAPLDRPLTERLDNHRHACDVCGRALFRRIGVVADRATKALFDPTLTLHIRFKAATLEPRPGLLYQADAPWTGHHGDHAC